jgi:hypothetical protein
MTTGKLQNQKKFSPYNVSPFPFPLRIVEPPRSNIIKQRFEYISLPDSLDKDAAGPDAALFLKLCLMLHP